MYCKNILTEEAAVLGKSCGLKLGRTGAKILDDHEVGRVPLESVDLAPVPDPVC